MCDPYSCIFYLIPNLNWTGEAAKTLNIHFLDWISLNTKSSTVNFRIQQHCHNGITRHSIFAVGHNTFHIMSCKYLGAHFKYCQSKTHVQKACKSHDLKMDFFHLKVASNSYAECISKKLKLG